MNDWRNKYARKIMNAEMALKVVNSGGLCRGGLCLRRAANRQGLFEIDLKKRRGSSGITAGVS